MLHNVTSRNGKAKSRVVYNVRDAIWMAEANFIAGRVASAHNMSLSKMMSVDRHRPVFMCRAIAAWVMRDLRGMSFPAIGAFFGKDHTTILHAIDRVNRNQEAKAFARQLSHEIRGDLMRVSDEALTKVWGGQDAKKQRR